MFANYKHTSPFTMTNLCTIDHSKITGYLRNYNPIKQYFCLLPRNDTSRPLVVLQEDLIQVDDLLFPCNIPEQIVKPLTVNKHLLSSPLDDKETSSYTTLTKLAHPYNELHFISARLISFMVQAEIKSEHKLPTFEHTSPIRTQNTSEKLSSILKNRTLLNITLLLDPYKRN